jgi:hypothetical protein
MFFLRAEGFSCSLGVLCIVLGINTSELQFLIRKINKTVFSCKIFKFLVIKTLDPELDPDPHLESAGSGFAFRNNAGSGSAKLNQCGSETLPDPQHCYRLRSINQHCVIQSNLARLSLSR